MLPSLVTTLVARHFSPGHAAMRDCRQSMSDQMYCRAWAATIPVLRTKRMPHAGDMTMRMTDPQWQQDPARQPHTHFSCSIASHQGVPPRVRGAAKALLGSIHVSPEATFGHGQPFTKQSCCFPLL